MRAFVNPAVDPGAVAAPSLEARAFHTKMHGYAATPLRTLPDLARELGLAAVSIKDESNRFGLPAFKVLGASWAVERVLAQAPGVHTLVAASAGNHGRAVAHVAALRGLACRVFLPARSAIARRDAIAGEGAEVVVVDGTYEEAVAMAAQVGGQAGFAEVADVGETGPARWVIDGYATLFAELAEQGNHDVIFVPIGVGSLGAAAARFGAKIGATVIGVEPATAACLTASLVAGRPAAIATPGTTMAGLDCAEVSLAAWPTLKSGVHATITVSDGEVGAAIRELAAGGLAIGESGAAPLAALRALMTEAACAGVVDALRLGPASRVALIATEGPTDPESYAHALGG